MTTSGAERDAGTGADKPSRSPARLILALVILVAIGVAFKFLPIGQWVEERVNAYEDFKRIHQHEPAEQAWGISIQGGPGVEVDFGPIAVSSPDGQ